MFLSVLTSYSFSGSTPSGWLWTPDTPFNLSAYPHITKADSFRILHLSDLHVHASDADTLNAMTVCHELITSTNPDLIIMTGDNTGTDLNSVWAAFLVEFFDSYGVPYTFTLGNHDAEGVDNEDIGVIFASGRFSLFDRGPGSIHGFCNSIIALMDPYGKLVYSLVLLDSNRYRDYSDGSSGYDYIYPDQVEWYEWTVKGLRAHGNGKNCLFYHIPLPEIHEVKEDYARVDPAAAADAFRMDPLPPSENSGLWWRVQDLGETSHMFFGHDHLNLVDYVWGGVHWVYALKTGKCHYHADDRIGGTLVTIGQDREVTVDRVFETDVPEVPQVKKFLESHAKRRPTIRAVERRMEKYTSVGM
jgi:predicted MPP superfamily phosphohydrolase